MARGSITGVEASLSMTLQPFGKRTKLLLRPPVYSFLKRKISIVAVIALGVICGGLTLPASCQSDQTDVHVVPREQKKDAKTDPTVMPADVAAEAKTAGVSVDPSLKTHT